MGRISRKRRRWHDCLFAGQMLLHFQRRIYGKSMDHVRTLSNISCDANNPVDSCAYVQLLQDCIRKKSLTEGKLIHSQIKERGFTGDRMLENTLVNMYVKCGFLADARAVFDQMPQRDVCSWTVMIAAYARHGPAEEALVLFHEMQGTGQRPNHFTYSTILSACANLASLEKGMEIHEELTRRGFQYHLSVANSLVDMYGKCGFIENARDVFDKMHQRDVVSWTTMVAGYAQNGFIDEALELFKEMPQRNIVSWNAVIARLVENGFVGDALKLFNEMPQKNVVSWTAMIAGFVRNGQGEHALKFFQQMQLTGTMPDSKTFTTILPVFANLAALDQGMQIHEKIIKNGLQTDTVVVNALIDMYAKCENIQKACELFNTMHRRDVVSWTAMIAGYAQNGFIYEALKLFKEMPERNVVSWNAMIAGFTQSGLVDEALKLFKEMPERTVASWNAMITGFAQNGFVNEALELFKEMPQQTFISWNTMIAGFAQNGLVDEALLLFTEMPEKNVVSWNSMIAGFAQNGQGEKALKLFQEMQVTGVKPDSMTFGCILPVCSNFAALEQGMEIHGKIIRSGLQTDVIMGNALIDMYAKCGNIQTAHELFDKIHQKNVVSWTAMIGGYAMHGCAKEALKLFEQMKLSGMRPDHITFTCVLFACSHAGLVDEGYQNFICMSNNYHIRPAMDHYNCIVDLLGRAGYLDEAQNFINKMPIKPDATVWSSLLGACRVHNDIELGEHAAEHIFKLDPTNDAPYVLLSNIYAAAGRWNDMERIRKIMKDRGVRKTPGCSWIEVNRHVHAFFMGNRSCQ